MGVGQNGAVMMMTMMMMMINFGKFQITNQDTSCGVGILARPYSLKQAGMPVPQDIKIVD
ncbi:hypothetical protein CAL7102_00655 [Dulcicalothrix desertica PCC 7102]|nr:hypothetical protein CAL7102_00655 [Dulcicalothrix desertica PCC 7102]